MRAIVVSPSAVLAGLVLALFLLNSGVAMRRALGRGDAGAAAFIVAATALMCALLATVRAHEWAAPEAVARRRALLRAAAWALSAALTAMFAHRIAGLAPAPIVATLVWGMAGTTVVGGFCCLFVHGDEIGRHGGADGNAGGRQGA
ncbi:unnamed protein product [Urochloa decumbens]|uniref:Uncharacterized protein n=1 Tax=Urochloa decumbens TaxID=240449 RepID=A0ABC8ZNM5_9POAL